MFSQRIVADPIPNFEYLFACTFVGGQAVLIAMQLQNELHSLIFRKDDGRFALSREITCDAGFSQDYRVGHHPMSPDAAVDAKNRRHGQIMDPKQRRFLTGAIVLERLLGRRTLAEVFIKLADLCFQLVGETIR